MKALTYEHYGSADVLDITDLPLPVVSPGQVLVQVHASAVNTADWRIRAGAFPGILAIPGRLMFGVTRPRNQRLGTEFAGTVADIGAGVDRFAVGERVFGTTAMSGGASAQYLVVKQDGAITAIPDGLSFREAAALPFGGQCALEFLSDFAKLQAGQRLLIVGASGGVGCYGVQIAKSLGAHVTGVCGPDSQTFAKDLGADVTIDYKTTDLASLDKRFDVILDTIGVLAPAQARVLLEDNGLFFPLNFGLREIGAALLNPMRTRKTRLAISGDTAHNLERLSALVKAGRLRPVIDSVYSLDDARLAHAHVEARHRQGAVVLQIAAASN